MNALQERIARLIAASGPITVAQFMTLALHDPDHGYYATSAPIGARGDFITAPEISQMFGELLALWCVQVWEDQGRPSRPHLVELGPGRGALMADALRALRVAPEFRDALTILLVEASPTLRAAQKERLAGYEITWMERFDNSKIDGPLFLLANEFFDALPVRQFVNFDGGWHERVVVADGEGSLSFALSPLDASAVVPEERRAAPAGAVFETAPATSALVEEIAGAIEARGGGALLIDYGYNVAGHGETLQAVTAHKFASVLDAPGEADLSAHVDFVTVSGAARRRGGAVYGPVSQGDFLTRLGIRERASRLAVRDRGVCAAVERLVGADQMGSLFKVLGIVPRHAQRPPGF